MILKTEERDTHCVLSVLGGLDRYSLWFSTTVFASPLLTFPVVFGIILREIVP